MSSALTAMVLSYQQKGIQLENLRKRIGEIVYLYPRKKLGWDHDTAGDFYLFFEPKIMMLLKNFTYTGIEFEAYLYNSLGWQTNSFQRILLRKSYKKEILESGAYMETMEPTCMYEKKLHDPEKLSSYFTTDSNGRIETDLLKQRFLIGICRAARHMTPFLIEKAARLTGYSARRLSAIMDQLIKASTARSQRVEAVYHRKNLYQFKIEYYRKALRHSPDDERTATYNKRLDFFHQKFTHNLQKLRKLTKAPTHTDIARVLEIPRGTVASTLSALKKCLEGRKKGGTSPNNRTAS